jgi:DNA (cytosine-5)-methyltransferase 1
MADLYCGAGGASEGYRRAGFIVVGVDVRPQPNYPGEFYQLDALEALADPAFVRRFDAFHASPPCQEFTRAKHLRTAQGGTCSAPSLIAPTRRLLSATGKPWIMENVSGAPLWPGPVLCGSMFGLKVRRHRHFECSFLIPQPPPCRHAAQGRPIGVYHRMGDHVPHGGTTARTLAEGQEAMGIDWMKWDELKEAIPPLYTEWLGVHLLAQIPVIRAA